MKKHIIPALACFGLMLMFSQCSQKPSDAETVTTEKKPDFGGYATEAEWGQHLVIIAGCNDCHTPKKMTDHGPDLDSSLLLSGHPAAMPAPDVDRKDLEKKGIAATQTLTAWVGPWGISYAGNITSDPTGIGGWEFTTFETAIRHGKYKGIETNRPLMPPMPWQMIKEMTDGELRAVFAFLKSTKPISNVVPQYQPPVSAPPHP
jgi:hypothetical protein